MTAIYISTLAGIAAAAKSVLSSAPNSPTPSHGLAALIAKRYGLEEITEASPLDASDLGRSLRQSPVLASYGFQLKLANSETRSGWIAALQTLQGRTRFPGDGQYFANDAVELLGVLGGILELEPAGGPHSTWLADLIRNGLQAKYIKTPITALAAIIALAKLDPSSDPPDFPYSQDELLRIDMLLLSSALTLVFDLPDSGLLPRLETAFSEQILEEQLRINSSAEAAAALVLSKRLADRILLGMQDELSSLDRVVRLCRRFPLFVKPLQSRHAVRSPFEINDEYDVQDLFHGILKLHFDDVRPEEVSPSVAGGSSRVDFYLKRERLIVEAKFMGPSMTQKKLRAQLIEDITLYSAMDHVDQLACVVYDPNLKCENPKSIEDDLQNTSGRLEVRIIVCPQGR